MDPAGIAEAKVEAEKLIYAYRTVFGVGAARTPQQQAVLDDMRRRARVDGPIFLLQNNGSLDPLKAAIAEGARIFFLDTENIIKTNPAEPKPAPKVTR